MALLNYDSNHGVGDASKKMKVQVYNDEGHEVIGSIDVVKVDPRRRGGSSVSFGVGYRRCPAR